MYLQIWKQIVEIGSVGAEETLEIQGPILKNTSL